MADSYSLNQLAPFVLLLCIRMEDEPLCKLVQFLSLMACVVGSVIGLCWFNSWKFPISLGKNCKMKNNFNILYSTSRSCNQHKRYNIEPQHHIIIALLSWLLIKYFKNTPDWRYVNICTCTISNILFMIYDAPKKFDEKTVRDKLSAKQTLLNH